MVKAVQEQLPALREVLCFEGSDYAALLAEPPERPYAHVLEEVSRPTFVAVLPVDPQHTRPRANLANVLYEPAPGTCWPGSNYGHSESAVIDQGDRGIAEKQSPSSLHVGDQDPKSHHVSGGKRIDAGVNYGVHQVTGPLSASPLLCLGDSVDEDSS